MADRGCTVVPVAVSHLVVYRTIISTYLITVSLQSWPYTAVLAVKCFQSNVKVLLWTTE